MGTISALEAKKAAYIAQENACKLRIKSAEQNYESLSNFKRTVESSLDNFETASIGKKTVLASVQAVEKNSLIAKRYYKGMKELVSTVGSNITNVAYGTLLAAISVKLRGYLVAIDSNEVEIGFCEQKIAEIESQISALQLVEKMKNEILGGV